MDPGRQRSRPPKSANPQIHLGSSHQRRVKISDHRVIENRNLEFVRYCFRSRCRASTTQRKIKEGFHMTR
jgi:hypothetical protein